MSAELETPLISPTAATPLIADPRTDSTAPTISVDAQLLNEEQQQRQQQQNWFDHYRARESTYYGAWRQVCSIPCDTCPLCLIPF